MEKIKEIGSIMWTFKLVGPFVLFGYLTGLVLALCWYWWDWDMSRRDVRIQLSFVCPVVLILTLMYWRPSR